MKFSITQNKQPLYSLGGWQLPDEEWYYIDQEGHAHQWNNKILPTLELIPAVTKEYWCDDCNDMHDEITEESYYVCKICREVVKPKYKTDNGPLYQMGAISYYIDDIPVTKEEFNYKKEEFYGKINKSSHAQE